MSGGDVGPLGEDAVNQLHGLFRWAARSRKGLLVFVDEAEAFLSARGKSSLSGVEKTHIRHALNALLYQTGTQSRSFMMVLATNRPEDLDAVRTRCARTSTFNALFHSVNTLFHSFYVQIYSNPSYEPQTVQNDGFKSGYTGPRGRLFVHRIAGSRRAETDGSTVHGHAFAEHCQAIAVPLVAVYASLRCRSRVFLQHYNGLNFSSMQRFQWTRNCENVYCVSICPGDGGAGEAFNGCATRDCRLQSAGTSYET